MYLLAQTFPELLADHAWKAGVLTAYVSLLNMAHSPRAKMIIFSMPVPFTCAFLASHLKINATHMTGMTLVTLYHWCVYLLHMRWRFPLLPTILTSAGLYVLIAALIRPLSAAPFLFVIFPVLGLWIFGVCNYKPIYDPGRRSPTPWWVKAPAIFTIGMAIYFLTGLLGGAVTSFPYAGVFTSYEMRGSLKTLAGQFMINNLSGWFLLIAMWSVQDRLSPPATLAVGWAVLICVLVVLYWLELGRPKMPKPDGSADPIGQVAAPTKIGEA